MRADALTVAQKHLLEIAKALAIKPRVLMLDEPTASLDQDSTEMLFERIRGVVRTGTSVIYITHRLAELRQIAHRVTVLRDGKVRGGGLAGEISDADLLNMIVGRALGSAFPPKPAPTPDGISTAVNFSVSSLSGKGFEGITFDVARGQIVGVAGVEGNGQAELMRALAGLQPSEGAISLQGCPLKTRELLQAAAFMPSDRHTEGLAPGLTVRENASFAALDRFAVFSIVSRNKELRRSARHSAPSPSRLPAWKPLFSRCQAAISKGRAVARSALRARPHRCRRTDAGRRCRRARRNLPDLA